MPEELPSPPLPPKTPARAIGADERWRVAGICAGLALLTFAVFAQTLRHQFVNFDDNDYVSENPVVARGLTRHGLLWAFSFHASNWHPLTWFSHMLDCQLYGLHAGGHHLTNVLLHLASVISLFLVLRQMTGALWRSAFVAAVFAIHPLRVESVAWVAERKDVLSGLFFMLTIGAYGRYAQKCRAQSPERNVFYALTLGLFVCGLMSKPMLVTLPLVLLLLDFWPLQRIESAPRLVMEKLPFLALSMAACALTLWAQQHGLRSSGAFTLPHRLGNALVACLIYLGQMFWPAGLAVLYPFPPDGQPTWEVALAVLVLAGISVVAWKARRTRPWLFIGWLWYLTMLLPVVGIIQAGQHAHADRYTYLPQIGLYVAATWWAAQWPIPRSALGGLAVAVLAALAICAWKQTGYWRDSETLWNHTLACTTNNDVAHYDLGLFLHHQGKVDEAMVHYREALQINPDYEEAHLNLGNALLQEDQVDQAVRQYQEALQLRPDYAEAHCELGIAFRRQGRLDEAIKQYHIALQTKPDSAEVHFDLGAALLQKGETRVAMAQFQEALQLQPGQPNVMDALAWLLATCPDPSLRNGRQALELARQANELTGGENPVSLHTLAAALAETGQFSEAKIAAQKAIELAQAAGQQNLAAQIGDELKRYEAGRSLHQ